MLYLLCPVLATAAREAKADVQPSVPPETLPDATWRGSQVGCNQGATRRTEAGLWEASATRQDDLPGMPKATGSTRDRSQAEHVQRAVSKAPVAAAAPSLPGVREAVCDGEVAKGTEILQRPMPRAGVQGAAATASAREGMG